MAEKPVKRVVLAYSGGLDSSTIVKWLQTELGAEVVTFTADLGQGEEVEPARQKAVVGKAGSSWLCPVHLQGGGTFGGNVNQFRGAGLPPLQVVPMSPYRA